MKKLFLLSFLFCLLTQVATYSAIELKVQNQSGKNWNISGNDHRFTELSAKQEVYNVDDDEPIIIFGPPYLVKYQTEEDLRILLESQMAFRIQSGVFYVGKGYAWKYQKASRTFLVHFYFEEITTLDGVDPDNFWSEFSMIDGGRVKYAKRFKISKSDFYSSEVKKKVRIIICDKPSRIFSNSKDDFLKIEIDPN